MKMTRSPSTAVVTNISPNHLDWHRDFNEYVAAKKRICASMPKDGLLVLNYDNDRTRAFAEDAGCRVRFFSRKTRMPFATSTATASTAAENCCLRTATSGSSARTTAKTTPPPLRRWRPAGGRRAAVFGAGIRRRSAPNPVRRGEKRRPLLQFLHRLQSVTLDSRTAFILAA